MTDDTITVKLKGTRVQFGVQGTVTANVAQNMEQDFTITYLDKDYDAHLWINPRKAFLTIDRDKLSKSAAAKLLQLIPILKGKKFDGFTLTKKQITSDYTQVIIEIVILGDKEIENGSIETIS